MLYKILDSAKYVTNNSETVKIDELKLNEFTNKIDTIKPKHWLSSSPYNLLELPIETIVNFLLVYESIDFSFWGEPKWTINTENGKQDGSIAMLYAILKYVKEKNSTDFSNITREEFSKILSGNIEIPLLENRYEIIKNVSQIVNENMDKNFYKFIKDTTSDLELFKIIITYFKNFKDERTYKGKTIYFYKLAQLLASDILHIREIKEKIEVDYSHLIGCADYKIPQVLRGLEILKYNNSLANIVDNKKEISQNSKYEIEIRANTLVAIDMIKNNLNNQVCAIDINDYLWNQSQKLKPNLKPYHLTRTINY